MKTSILATSLIFAAIAGASAGERPNLDGAPPARPAMSSPMGISGQTFYYRVTDMCSVSSGNSPCATVIQINNLSGSPCNVGVQYYVGFSNTPSCTTTFPNLAAWQQATHCSRDPGSPESCNATCSPELSLNSGYAHVYASCPMIGVQATIITKDSTNTNITSARSVNLVAIHTPPATRANHGD